MTREELLDRLKKLADELHIKGPVQVGYTKVYHNEVGAWMYNIRFGTVEKNILKEKLILANKIWKELKKNDI